jgi:hypothetical protein
MKTVITCALLLLTYSSGIIKWIKTVIHNVDVKLSTLFTKFNKHHPKSTYERFNLSRENVARGFAIYKICLIIKSAISKTTL